MYLGYYVGAIVGISILGWKIYRTWGRILRKSK